MYYTTGQYHAAIDDCARVTRCNLLAVDSQQVSRWTIAVCVPHAAHSSVDSKCKLEDLVVLYVIFTCSVPTFLNLRTMAVPVVIYEHQNMSKYMLFQHHDKCSKCITKLSPLHLFPVAVGHEVCMSSLSNKTRSQRNLMIGHRKPIQ